MGNDLIINDENIDILIAEALQIKEDVNELDIELFWKNDLPLSSEEETFMDKLDDFVSLICSSEEKRKIIPFPTSHLSAAEEHFQYCVGFNRRNDEDIQDKDLLKKLEENRKKLLKDKDD